VCGGYPFEQCVQGCLLLGVQGRKDSLFCLGERVFDLGESASSLGREADRVAASCGERRRSIRSSALRSINRPTRLVRSTRSPSPRSDWLLSPTS